MASTTSIDLERYLKELGEKISQIGLSLDPADSSELATENKEKSED